MKLKDLTDRETTKLILEQLGLVYIVHTCISPAVLSLKLYLYQAETIKKIGFEDTIIENLEKMVNKLLCLVSNNIDDELVIKFINKIDEIFPKNTENHIEKIENDLMKGFFKVLSVFEQDLDVKTKH